MAYERIKKQKKRRKLFRGIIISSIFIFILFRSVPSILANNSKTVLPEKGTLIDTISAQGFLIKNETVVKSKNVGQLERITTEGDRLPAGQEIAIVKSNDENSHLIQELELVESSIDALKKTQNEAKIILDEKTKIEDLIVSLVDEIQNNISTGNFQEIYLLKEQLALYHEKSEGMPFTNTLVGQSLEKLEGKKEEILSILENNNIKYYSPHGGIVSFQIDGYEEIFLPKDFDNYTYDKLVLKSKTNEKNKDNVNVTLNMPICKIIDNFEWYMAMKVENMKEVEDFEVGNSITVILGKDKHEIRGRIIAINETDEKGVIVAKFNTMLHEFYDLRVSHIQIIKSKKEGYKIPTKAIVENDSVKGVYIKDKSGIVKFRPVNIIGEDSNYTYVDIGDNKGNIKIKDELVKTITLFDEIFVNTNNIKEGQILN